MEAIAEHAGVSKVTLYRHWPSKAALLAEALLQELARAIPLDETDSPADAIRSHAAGLGEALEGRIGELFRSVVAECLADADALAHFRDRYLSLRRQTAVRIIRRGLASGQLLAGGKPEEIHDALYGALFYRFLFGFRSLERREVTGLVQTILQPAKPAPRRPQPSMRAAAM
jgi:AcrR family transcriptional regulator